jgi:paraquat-inducible protein B
MLPTSTQEAAHMSTADLSEAEALGNDLKHLLVRSEQELIKGDARELVERLERWVESYRRGLSAAQKIADNGTEMLHKTRDQLKLALEEQLRLEDEGGNPPASKEQAAQVEQIAKALQRIDRLIPTVEQSFPCTPKEEII